MNVLIFGAHPDDIESFCGGTALRYAQMGANLYFCVATNGNVGSPTLSKEETAILRRGEAQAAADMIGAQLIWLGFDDEFLLDSVETRHAFINAMRIADPDVVISPCRTDYNPDHSITGYIVDECLHMAGVPNIETEAPPTKKPIPHLYFMDTPAGVGFEPELYVDITSVFEKKVELLACHKSQNAWMKKLFNYEMDAFLEIPARYRGLQAGVPMAEGFIPSYRWGRTFIKHYLPDCLGGTRIKG
ncbi:MAG: PIG-L family deacetylase [Sphaerochaetaceae bacterium]